MPRARCAPWRDPARAALGGDTRPRARRIGESMTKRRVHEIAKEHGLSSKELLEKLQAAGIEAKAAASSVEEALALKAIGDGASPGAPQTNGAPAATKPTAETAPAPKPAAPLKEADGAPAA